MSTTTPVRPATPEPATPPPPPPPPRRSLGAMTVGLVLVGVGTVALLATLGIDIPVAVVGPVLLVVLGIGVVVSGIRGEFSGGVVGLAIVLGVLLALGSLVGMVLDVPLRGVVGERHHRPASVAELEPNYRVLMGELELDLRDLQLSPGTTTIEASAVLGEVIVRVPPGTEVSVEADVGGGTATVFGEAREGLSVDHDHVTDGYDDADARVRLDLGVGLGEVRVTR